MCPEDRAPTGEPHSSSGEENDNEKDQFYNKKQMCAWKNALRQENCTAPLLEKMTMKKINFITKSKCVPGRTRSNKRTAQRLWWRK